MSFRARGRTISRRSRCMLDLDVEKQMLSLSAIYKLHMSDTISNIEGFQNFAINCNRLRDECLDDGRNVVPTFVHLLCS